MGIDAQLQGEDGRSMECLGDPRGCLARFLVMADLRTTVCLRFIDPYGDAIFNSLQIPVLESEIMTGLGSLGIGQLRANRKHELAEAIRLGWQESVIEELRKGVGTNDTDSCEIQEVRVHMERLLEFIGRARKAGAHTYLRFIGD